ncbi:MAG: nitroreductase family protein [Oscillospiraceae bacterium]|nr:nitroreductase family protein [Oscillospiraceae bacterium]
MTFLDLAKKRYSCRSYSDRPVEPEVLKQILSAAHVAPTGANRQPQRLIVVQTKEAMEQLGKAANLHGAPMAIVVCADRDVVWTRECDHKQITDIDATIVTDHMMLAAADLGVDSVWICAFDPTIVRTAFQIPDHWDIVNILALGYGNGPVKSPDRHDTERFPMETYTKTV